MCAVRELNPQPADSDYSPVDSCRRLWKPLCRNESRDSHHRSAVVICRCLPSKYVAKCACDGGTLAFEGVCWPSRGVRAVGVRTATRTVATRLRERGWLLPTGQRGVWEFAPAAVAGAYSLSLIHI